MTLKPEKTLTVSHSEVFGLCVVMMGFVLAGLLRLNDLSLSTDSTRYLIWGTSLAAGKGFVDFTLPVPTHFVMNAPLYAVLLAPMLALFPLSLTAAKIWTLAWGAAGIGIFYLWLRRHASAGPSFVATLWLAANSLYFVVSTEVLSEAPFIALMILCFLLLERPFELPVWWRDAVIVLLLGFLPLLREIGFAVVVGAALVFAFERRYRRAIVVLIAAAGFYGLWTFRNTILVGSEGTGLTANLQYITRHFVTSPETSLVSEFFTRFGLNLRGYVLDIGGRIFYPFPLSLMGAPPSLLTWFSDALGILNIPILVVLGGIAGYGLTRDALHSRRGILPALALLGFALIVLFYPVHDIRFLLPFLPLILFGVVRGCTVIAERTGVSWRQRLRNGLMVAGLALVVPNILADAEVVRTNLAYLRNPDSFAGRQSLAEPARAYFAHSWRLVGKRIGEILPGSLTIGSPVKEIAPFVAPHRVQELSRTLPPPLLDRIIRLNDVSVILSKPLWTTDSSDLLGMLWSYDLSMQNSRRYRLVPEDTISGILISRIVALGDGPAPEPQTDTSTVAGLLVQARSDLGSANLVEALKHLEHAIRLAPDQPEVLFQLVAVRSMLGDSAFAAQQAARLFTMPQTTAYLPLIQLHLRALGLVTQARHAGGMTRASLSVQAARLYDDLGYPAVALRLLRDFQQSQDPDFPSLLWSSYFAKQAGDTASSYRDLDRLISIDPRAPILSPLVKVRDLEHALRQTVGGKARALLHRAIAGQYVQLELPDDATDEFDKARRSDPDNTDLLMEEAKVLETAGGPVAARTVYEEVLRIDPERQEARARVDQLSERLDP